MCPAEAHPREKVDHVKGSSTRSPTSIVSFLPPVHHFLNQLPCSALVSPCSAPRQAPQSTTTSSRDTPLILPKRSAVDHRDRGRLTPRSLRRPTLGRATFPSPTRTTVGGLPSLHLRRASRLTTATILLPSSSSSSACHPVVAAVGEFVGTVLFLLFGWSLHGIPFFSKNTSDDTLLPPQPSEEPTSPTSRRSQSPTMSTPHSCCISPSRSVSPSASTPGSSSESPAACSTPPSRSVWRWWERSHRSERRYSS